MAERRKNERLCLEGKIVTKRLDLNKKNPVTIDVYDISKTGIGFLCEEQLVIGAVYEMYLTLWTKEVIHGFFEVVRVELKPDKRLAYGAIFVGMSEVDAGRIEAYRNVMQTEDFHFYDLFE